MDSKPFGERRTAARGTSRLYLFCLVGMTVFLLAIIASGSVLSIHQAETSVLLRADSPELNAEALQAQMLARDNLLPALNKIGLAESAAPRVTLEARRGDAGEVRVHVVYTDINDARASALVTELAERCVAAYRRQLQQYLSQQVEQTLQEKQQLDQEIRQFLEEILPKTGGLSTYGWRVDPWRKQWRVKPLPRPLTGDGPVTAAATIPGDSGDDPNEIRRELAEQDRLLTQLRETRTDAHPEVQDVLLDIQRLEARLLALDPNGPKRPAMPQPSPASGLVGSLAPTSAVVAQSSTTPATAPPTPNLTEAQTAAAAALKAYRERFAALNARHESLVRAEQGALEQRRSLDDSAPAQIEPIRHAALLDRDRWQQYLALMAAMAGTLGLGMVWLAKRGDQAFYSAAQVGRELDLPVVGALAGETMSVGRVAHLAQRGIRLACEGALAMIVIWLAVLSALDRSFLVRVSNDPLPAIALAWQHMLG